MIRPKQQRASHGVPLRVAAAVPAAPVGLRAASKIRREHLDRLAVVYVRQSSPQQVLENRESRCQSARKTSQRSAGENQPL